MDEIWKVILAMNPGELIAIAAMFFLYHKLALRKFDAIDKRFDKIDARFDKMDSRMDRLELTMEKRMFRLETVFLAKIPGLHLDDDQTKKAG